MTLIEIPQYVDFAKYNGKNVYVIFDNVSIIVKYGITKLKKNTKKIKYIKRINHHCYLKNNEIIEIPEGYYMNQFTCNELRKRIIESQENKNDKY